MTPVFFPPLREQSNFQYHTGSHTSLDTFLFELRRSFLEGKDPWVTKALRFLVCLEQRNRSINKSRWSAEKEYSSYSNFLAEKKKSANIVVKVEKNWSMQIDTDWDGTFSL